MAVEGFDLSGKNALVIGAGSSVGRAIALALAEAGARVTVASAGESKDDVAAAEETARQLAARGQNTTAKRLNPIALDRVEAIVADAASEMGSIDILVNCCDLFMAKPVAEITAGEWDKVLRLNLDSVFFACKAVGPLMLRQKRGRIINVASGLGERGLPNCSAYCAAKGGVLNLSRALAQEWAAQGITVNCIAPAWMEDTPGLGDPNPEANRLIRFIPMRRPGKPEEVGPLAVYLASDSAGYMTGRTLFVDGGLLAHL
ncbi:MAG: SDR family oxidoreductase [Dehalococcoidia bacterium]|nr:SDR family oxidoreductase [Dehalococcoidia bacterium]